MREAIITSSILIVCIVLLRGLCKGRISAKLQYMLWLIVAVRLMMPGLTLIFPNLLPEADFSIMNAADKAEEAAKDYIQSEGLAEPIQWNFSLPGNGLPFLTNANSNGPTAVFVAGRFPAAVVWMDIFKGIWCFGMVVAGIWMIAVNIRFMRKLRKSRSRYEYGKEDFELPIYLAKELSSPCLYGLPGRQAVYLPEDVAEDAEKVRHILAHEYCHYKQKDVIWSGLRCILVMVYWFHPLVWLAAVLSRQDCELACDEASIKLLGEEERIAYGKTLVSLITRKTKASDLICTATTMTSGAEGIKERVRRIAERPRRLAILLIPVLVVVGAVVTFTFTQAKDSSEDVYFLEEGNSLTVTTDCFQMTFPDSLIGKVYYRIENDTDVIVYHKDTDREIGRFFDIPYGEEAIQLAKEKDLTLIGYYGQNVALERYISTGQSGEDILLQEAPYDGAVPGTDSNEDETTYIVGEDALAHTDSATEKDITTYIYPEDKDLATGSSGGVSPIPAPEEVDSETIHLPYNEAEDYAAEDISEDTEYNYLPNEEVTVSYHASDDGSQVTTHTYEPAEVNAEGVDEPAESHTYYPSEINLDMMDSACYLYMSADNSDADEAIQAELTEINQLLLKMTDSVTVLYISEETIQKILGKLAENRTPYMGDSSKLISIVNTLLPAPGLTYQFLETETLAKEDEISPVTLYYVLWGENFALIDEDILLLNAALMFATVENLEQCNMLIRGTRVTAAEPNAVSTVEIGFERSQMEELFGPLYPCSKTKKGLTDLYNRVLEYLKEGNEETK
ncbi:MAG: DUF4825 domain-containing protein [Lachnospiraceae bacterium]|nr:DUF4825 domain-containing protein [Lachnospiraceae bacterium]